MGIREKIYRRLLKFSMLILMSLKIARKVPLGISLPECLATTVLLPSGRLKTRYELPRSGCSKNPSFLRTWISSRSLITGSLGISFYSFYDFYAFILRNLLFVGDYASQININSIPDIFSSLIKSFSPGMTARQGRDISMKSIIFVRFNNNSICI